MIRVNRLEYGHRPRRWTEEDTRRIQWLRTHWRIPHDWEIQPVELVERNTLLEHTYTGYRIVDTNGQTVWYALLR